MGSVSQESSSSRVGIVTVSYGSSDAVVALLDSIPGSTTRPVDVVVVDNLPGGDADLEATLRGRAARIVSRPDNPGYGGGINAGAATFGTDIDWIFVVNPDLTLDAGSLDELLRVGEHDATIGALGPRIRDHDGVTYPSARAIPSVRLGIGHALLGDVAPANPWTKKYHRFADYDVQRDAGWLSGACVLVRRSAYDSVSGFDDEFFMYFEDVDLGFRLGTSGWRNVFVPTATASHEGGHSTRKHSAAMIRAHHSSARRWITKRYPGAAGWPIRTVINLGLRLREAVMSSRR
jgi:N-acetylglucosaminyl-diphospho-decaprenol L-rhamnosyltransferase